jgi:hypothetical protein
MSGSRLPSRPFGISAWAAPYVAGARLILGTSAAAPLRLSEFAELAGFDVEELFAGDPWIKHGPVGGSAGLPALLASMLGVAGADEVALTAGAGEALFAFGVDVAAGADPCRG